MIQIPEEDLLLTVGTAGAAEIKVKGSRFIALAQGAALRTDAGKIVLGEEKKYHAANHHCWAWRSAGRPEAEYAWDDDGEPSGTAGAPILKAIDGKSLVGAVVVVTRYFGGTKLGTGGLARAYSEAALAALAAAVVKNGMNAKAFSLSLEYPRLGTVSNLLEAFPCRVLSRDFGARAGLNIAVAASRAEDLLRAVSELTAGAVVVAPGQTGPVFF
ncbi:MAG TPA: YigZ family protein [Candidatus Glassbacteria bacterium]|nr:YigZ family protein [Candidatus Glassbacteria bacterium]